MFQLLNDLVYFSQYTSGTYHRHLDAKHNISAALNTSHQSSEIL